MKSKVPSPRSYQSPLREAHAAQTRERIIAAALHYLESHESDTLSLRRVGDLAGVSAPTVYAHFPTLDALYLGIFETLQPRLGLEVERHPSGLQELGDLPGTNFPAYAEHSRALSALLLAPGYHRARRSRREERLQHWVEGIAAGMPQLPAAQRRLKAFVINAFWTPTMWHWLTGTCGLSTEEAVAAASWAIRSLAAALRNEAAGRRGGSLAGKNQPVKRSKEGARK
ncbi:MAG: TetR/AcrR family transcriptional regulator [Bryobacterales bacterium]|nr:TetR/AcrR family transcriptional regulator [Bryobacterales bacterium]